LSPQFQTKPFSEQTQAETCRRTNGCHYNWKRSLARRQYPLQCLQNAGLRHWIIIDETMNKLRDQGKAGPATQLASFAVPVFVVWKETIKHVPDGLDLVHWKGRPVLDLRDVNSWTIKDACPLTT
jgi:hypothetical protein